MPCCNSCMRDRPVHETFNGNNYCETCASRQLSTCSDCEVRFDSYVGHDYNVDGEMVCHGCGKNYFYCETCDSRHLIEDRYNQYCCNACRIVLETQLIKPYNYVPKEPKFYGKAPFFMGVELEVECDADSEVNTKAKQVVKILGDFVYLKNDGSLIDGFEIVSHPATLAQHKLLWNAFLDNPPK